MKRKEANKIKAKLTEEEFAIMADTVQAQTYSHHKGEGYYLDLKKLRALEKAKEKAPKFVLELVSFLPEKYFLSSDLRLTNNKADALKFALGFVDEERTIITYKEKTGLHLKSTKLYGKEKG